MVFTVCPDNATYLGMEVQAQYEGVDDSKHWVAIGFSRDDKMGDDGVFLCHHKDKDYCNKFWNVDTPSKNTVKTKDADIESTGFAVNKGFMYAAFKQKFPFTWTNPSNGKTETFDDETIHTVFIASGQMSTDMTTPLKHKHHAMTPSMGFLF